MKKVIFVAFLIVAVSCLNIFNSLGVCRTYSIDLSK